MSARLVVPPAGLPVPLAAAIAKAKADGAGLDAEIELDVRGIAGEVEHELGRALCEQTWVVTLSGFPSSIKLHLAAPLIAIEHVKFYDADGNLQTLDPQDYMAPKTSEPACLMPAPGRRWPDTALRADAVEVQYRCGYGPDHAAVPAQIQSYILGRIEAKYLPAALKNAEFLGGLLDRFKVY
ncbi:hypothetical protein [Massilia sp. BHUDP2]|uniref:head-tail connector protein n=1 Tax=Massilia sp. BHUDP2 TaxID=3034505 RepID=UPI00390637FC